MPTLSIHERRRLKRTALKKRAGLVVNCGRQEERIPCLILDNSQDGFKVGGTFRPKRGQVVELILDEHPLNVVLCSVMWVGKPGSKQAGELGLNTLIR